MNMSGGSYDYTYQKIEEQYVGHMFDSQMDELMTDLVQLTHALEWWQSGDSGEASRQDVEFESLRILVAEDSLVNQKLAVGLLQKHGHSVTIANNGKEAVNAVSSEQFDLVLMDVEMPEMDGLEATAAIRAWEKSRGVHMPIIAMTAHAMKSHRDMCLEAGMDD